MWPKGKGSWERAEKQRPHTPACSPGAPRAGEPQPCAQASAVGAQSPLEDGTPVRAGARGERGAHPAPQGCPHVRHVTQTHRKSLSPSRDLSLSGLPSAPRSLAPSLLPPHSHSFVLMSAGALRASQLGSLSPPPLSVSLSLTFLVSVLSDTSLPRVPPPLSPPRPPLVSSLHRLSWPPAGDCIAWVEAAGTL